MSNTKGKKQNDVISLPELNGQSTVSEARHTLLDWYDNHKRVLPWRDIEDPWLTWVSEIMLQQTRVSSVIEYFERFIKRFPTPAALAAAEWDEVASLWAGLGYYSRAKNLWRGAQQVVELHQGTIPSTKKEVLALNGIGPYTAGAILSIAFNQEEPLVDGNVIRVFSRLYMIDSPIQNPSTQKLFWALAAEWVKGKKPGDLNQGLMELGATICSPKKPICLLCPLQQDCVAYNSSNPLDYPVKIKKIKKKITEGYLAVILTRESRSGRLEYGVVKRKTEGLLGGLWALPMKPREGIVALRKEEFSSWFASMNVQSSVEEFGEVKHAFTHKVWHLWFQQVHLVNGHKPLQIEQLEWRDIDELDQMALGGPSLKALIQSGAPLTPRRGSGR